MKTYGEVGQQIAEVLKAAREDVYQQYFSTPEYFTRVALATHQAFEKWCFEHNIRNMKEMNDFRIDISKHMIDYQYPNNRIFKDLLETLPTEYNVRGQWVPTYLNVKIY